MVNGKKITDKNRGQEQSEESIAIDVDMTIEKEEPKKKLMKIKIVSLNVRSVESDIKKEILQKFIRDECMDRKVLAFNETHLKEPMQCRGWNINQG